MSLASSSSLVTSEFQLNIPRVLQPVSSSLAALHVSRARILHYPQPTCDDLVLSHCVKCGTFLLDGTGSVRSIRKSRLKQTRLKGEGALPPLRLLRRSCGFCGHTEDVSLGSNSSPLSTRAKHPGKSTLATAPTTSELVIGMKGTPARSITTPLRSPVPQSALSRSPSIPPQVQDDSTGLLGPSRPKARSRKSRGLQDIFARNKLRQETENKSQTVGLSAFCRACNTRLER